MQHGALDMELVSEGLTNILAILSFLIGAAFAGWWAIGYLAVRSRESETHLPEIDVPGDIKENFTGIPPVLTVFLIFSGITMVAYVLAVWLTGVSY